MAERPSGTVTFLFTDIEGSTRLWEEQPENAARLVADHDRIMQATIEAHGGRVFSTAGDSYAAAFPRTTDAVQAAVDAQLALRDVVAVRMAVHSGPVESRDGDYYGPTLNRAGRLRDAAHGGQIICSQSIADALGQATVDLLDLGEHRLKDLGRPEHIHQILHSDLESEFAPLNTLTVDRTNLPIQVTSFIGRHQEMAEIKKLLHASRLVTLTGAGGCGKSRLAMETAAALVDEFPDGVWIVELAAIVDEDLVAQTVATLIGVQAGPGVSPIQATVDKVKRRKLLLVLDNCEHLLDSTSNLAAAVLREAADVRLLATSQEPLHVQGETIYPVPPLPLPDPRDSTAVIAHSDAVRLFVERAAAVSPDFRLTTDTAPTVASICRHLDGIPLAIELAAASTRLLPIGEIEARLDDRFGLLRHGNRDPLPHHRTLEAAIDWSYQHLTPEQRVLFARLAVFDGGWTIDAAQQVCSGPPISANEVLALLGELVDRSLVRRVEGPSGARFDFLETIHVYATTRTTRRSGGELASRHALYFTELAELLGDNLEGGRAEDAYPQFTTDLPNMRTALRSLDQTGDIVSYCRLLIPLALYLPITANYEEGEALFDHAIDLLTPNHDPGLRGRVLLYAARDLVGQFVVAPGRRTEKAVQHLQQAVPLLTQEGDDLNLARALLLLLEYRPEYEQQAIEAAERTGDPKLKAQPHLSLGIAALMAGRFDKAVEHFDHLLESAESIVGRTTALSLKALTLSRIDPLRALPIAEEAVKLHESHPDLPMLESTLRSQSDALLESGHPDEALKGIYRQIELGKNHWGEEGAGEHADAAYAAAQLHDPPITLHHFEQVKAFGTTLTDDAALPDQLNRAFLAAALIALDHQDAETAVLALAAETVYRTTHTFPPNYPRQQRAEQLINHTGSLLPPDLFDAAWQHGTTLTLDDIIDLALDRYGETGPDTR